MIATNTTKLFVHNGGLVWRIMLYLVVSVLIIGGLSIAVCYPFIAELMSAGVFNEIFLLLTNNIANVQMGQMFSALADIIVHIFEIIASNLGLILPMAILLFVIICVLGGFLVGLAELAVADYMYGYMSSNTKYGFMNCFVKNIVKSIKLQLLKCAVLLPFRLVVCGVIIGGLLLFTTGNFWLILLAPFMIILVLCLLFALKNAFFSAWIPCVVVRDLPPLEALRLSISDVTKNFGKIYGRYFVVAILMVAVSFAAITLTASVGLLLVVPAYMLFATIINMVIYFYINGLKFYVDSDEIITSKKKEDWENINSLKYII